MPRSIVHVSGHIVDSLILPKILDIIISLGAEFQILDIHIGQRRADRSSARIQIDAPTEESLQQILAKVKEHGALPLDTEEEAVRFAPAAADGIFPINSDETAAPLNGTALEIRLGWNHVLSCREWKELRYDAPGIVSSTIPNAKMSDR